MRKVVPGFLIQIRILKDPTEGVNMCFGNVFVSLLYRGEQKATQDRFLGSSEWNGAADGDFILGSEDNQPLPSGFGLLPSAQWM
jgi:hypothetical protein